MELREGSIISGPFWGEAVRVEKVEAILDRIRIVGYTINSKQFVDRILKKEDLERVKILKPGLDFSANSENAFYFLEAIRFRNASLFDPLLAVNVSKIDPLPFQIEAVYGYILKQPRIRFLLADDP
ncbi:MAG: hypothetical protein QXN39_03615, partial [Archaeoglobaceae archaeon]